MKIYFGPTPFGTSRLWMKDLDQLSDQQVDRLMPARTMLDLLSCWGGADRVNVSRDGECPMRMRLQELAWELPASVAEPAFAVVKQMLQRLGQDFSVDTPRLQ